MGDIHTDRWFVKPIVICGKKAKWKICKEQIRLISLHKTLIWNTWTGSGAHPASCTMGTGGSFPGGKAPTGRDYEHSLPSGAEVKNEQELYLFSPGAPPWRVVGLFQL
jgi:hypothetical protein